ncbi:type II toxin-antitoxin system VapC family toxin [Pararhizobium sp. YC-54]|uniref:type II toxin-antitoxin system VapC family toxin n=1 Tax=Pararhizobium sp. YC-54 TaxID=2986920 RepID=UPI0021F6C718|nr:type II toxin-antitoxin system VapC family toxin [Pararhizobium sp. YC-54]MCV9999031.1 type II toxin-antitoxin system VapC family toxin [Pararhizobium sp. YC-54]
MIVLDTNIISELVKSSPDKNVGVWFRREAESNLYLNAIVVMEQSFGAERFYLRTGSDRYVRSLEHLLATQFRGRILGFSDGTPALTGRLRAKRESAGRPISVQDAMIAAICLSHDATLATRNTKDFEGLDLKLVNPFEEA